MADPVHVTDQTFKEEVLDSDVPVIVDFWAEWCMPCKPIAQVIEELAGEYEGRAKMAKVDVDSNQEVAASLGIRSIPMLIFFKGGEHVDHIIGAVPKQMITEKLEKLL
jgi:thioredoxin 1